MCILQLPKKIKLESSLHKRWVAAPYPQNPIMFKVTPHAGNSLMQLCSLLALKLCGKIVKICFLITKSR